jgi:hypothetical protein
MTTAPVKKIVGKVSANVSAKPVAKTSADKTLVKPNAKTSVKPAETVTKISASTAPQARTTTIPKVAIKKLATKIAAPTVKKTVTPPVATVEKPKKVKLVRDSFTIPENEYVVLSDIKKALLAKGVEVKKSQLLRVGLVLLRKAGDAELKRQLAELAPLKAGRPKKDK